MKLTDTQLVLLSAASQRDDCAIEIAPNLKGGAARNVVGKLLSEGLVEEIHAGGSLEAVTVTNVAGGNVTVAPASVGHGVGGKVGVPGLPSGASK